ncbi:hypothetical protein LCGC14_1787550 [marine sediment metagenome]|uniref:LamG-like jellyroll fold domain-containing protein n=1 Tax=marine sediment metagenome TaxID=412755 RepID=A0A0F9HG41_9ZZZZ
MVQKRNSAMVELLRPDFQARNEPNFAWKSACSVFQALTGLRGSWPLSSFNEAGNAYDMSEQGRVLTYNGNPVYNYEGLIPYLDFDGTGDFLSRADEAGLDIIGTETFVAAAARGLTIGGWFAFDNLTREEALIGKWNTTGNQRSYILEKMATDFVRFAVSVDGTAETVVNDTVAVTTTDWFFAVGRFDPSAAMTLFINGRTIVGGAGPATINNSNAQLNIGAHNNGAASLLDGKASMNFLCAAQLSNTIIDAMFEQTRSMYGI